MSRTRTLLASLTVIALLLGHPVSDAHAQGSLHLAINLVEDTDFPLVRIHLTVADASGLPIHGLGAEAFSVTQEGRPVQNVTASEVAEGEQPIYVVLAIDTSYSMTAAERSPAGGWASAMANAKSAALQFIRSLRASDQVAVVAFSNEASVAMPLTNDFDRVANAINALQPQGATAMYDALATSIDLLRVLPAGRKAVILLSDGEDSSSTVTFQDVINQAQYWAIPVYPIGFGDVSQNTIQRLARLTGGYAQIKPDSASLADALASALEVLRHQYVLEFTSSLQADGRTHALGVAVEVMDQRAQDETEFIARPGEVTIELAGWADGQVVGGDVVLTPTWLAPASLARVEYLLDGGLLGFSVEAPFTFTWDSTLVEPGDHVLTIRATDAAGNPGTRDYRVVVRPPVIVAWVSPQSGAAISGSTNLEVDIDAIAQVARVDFYLDDTLLGTATSAPYRLEWSPRSAPAGPHRLRALVSDANGKTGTAEIEVTIVLRSGVVVPLILAAALAAALLVLPVGLRRRRRLPAAGHLAATAGPPSATLLEVQGLEPGKVWPIVAAETRLGRKRDENDIIAAGRSASRRHALIRVVQGQYVLFDLNPANPTLVNGEPAQGQRTLQPGDMLQIGESVFRFQVGPKEKAE